VSLDNRIAAYVLPPVLPPKKAPRPEDKDLPLLPAKTALDKYVPDHGPEDSGHGGEQPILAWTYQLTNDTIITPPIVGATQVGGVTTRGDFLALSKFTGKLLFDFRAGGSILKAAGQHGPMVYFGAEDGVVYAMNTSNGELVWRFLGGTPILRRMIVTD